MGFDIGEGERRARQQARWLEYVSDGGTILARFKVRPRDEAVVKRLNEHFPQPERIGRAGRVTAPRSEEDSRKWNLGYVAAHLESWDVTADGAPASITEETVGWLTDGMRAWILEKTMTDDLRECEATGPLAG